MQNLDDVTRLPDDFDGRVRLFPLPELVVFPHAMQPLQIFEPRYCEMLRESLESDRLIAMATLQGGVTGWAQSSPPIAPYVCVSRIVTHAEVESDRHNILLVGTKRAKLIREVDAGRPFRIADVVVTDDVYPPAGAEHRPLLKRQLLEVFGSVIPASPKAKQHLYELMAGEMGLGPITDIIAYTLPFDTADKLRLLGISDVDQRATELTELLRSGKVHVHSVSAAEQQSEATPPEDERFPPPFSVN